MTLNPKVQQNEFNIDGSSNPTNQKIQSKKS